ncbi:40S ribosomal protein S6 [Durusdinium trenchii]|uniref:40S ribosomal protein S6 n=1 Tax=Durusdinium trenchii TaxID=1381693 RepID=A0ABP0MX64_9DINO
MHAGVQLSWVHQLHLLPGFFSSKEEPGMIFQCFGEPERCPGGDPGTCAAGRDVDSIACSTCLDGLHADGGVCVPCETGDYFLIIVVTLLVCAGIVVLYVVSLRKGQKSAQPGSLLIAALGLGQMITVVQQLTVIQQFKIQWGEPFSSMLVSFDIFAFDLDLISLGCVAPMAPVAKFTMRTLLVLVFFAVACLVHFFFIAMFQKGKGLQLSVLGGTVGTLFMIFFISVCSSLLAPFRCYAHPNGRSTVQAYHSVLCDMNNEHLQMSLVGGLCCLLPIAFLTVCSYITLVKLPSWIADGEVKLIRSCSFLFMRFRPGAEVYSVLFSVRNALVVLCPLLPSASGRILCMNLVLYGSLVMVAYGKPWRATLCNTLDLFLLAGMLVILDMGSLFVLNIDGPSTAAICIVFSTVMFISIVAAVFYGIAKHVMLKYHKPFRYFVCHQKNAAGSYARLLKIELQKRGPRFSTFIDCDDLNDLTKLFSYVGQDTQTLLILGSPQILTRKWCVGEMVTGRIENVHTVLLTFPGFVMPDESFIETYTTLVPDITELANYNIGLDEVKETLRWINTVSTVDVPALIHPETITDVVNALTDTRRAASTNVDAHQESCKQQLQYANACNNMLTLHPVVLLCCDALLRSG